MCSDSGGRECPGGPKCSAFGKTDATVSGSVICHSPVNEIVIPASASVGGSPTRPWLLARANSSEVNLHQQHLSSAGFSAAFLSVLEHLCSLYETEPRRREKLFQGKLSGTDVPALHFSSYRSF